eukprot:Tamp_18079.p1 GENE.Tamp_18079~~Tamp_18079.p1  ORF type:complete len:257 (+),score=49.55 Tamp_18079:245-1015(+)
MAKVYGPGGASFVPCFCGKCGATFPASQWWHKIGRCARGAATPQEWLNLFEIQATAPQGKKRDRTEAAAVNGKIASRREEKGTLRSDTAKQPLGYQAMVKQALLARASSDCMVIDEADLRSAAIKPPLSDEGASKRARTQPTQADRMPLADVRNGKGSSAPRLETAQAYSSPAADKLGARSAMPLADVRSGKGNSAPRLGTAQAYSNPAADKLAALSAGQVILRYNRDNVFSLRPGYGTVVDDFLQQRAQSSEGRD